MVNCCVPYCHSYKENPSSKGVSYHEFPVNEEVRSKWMQNIRRKDWTPADRSMVCSRHFLPEDYKPGSKTKYLKNGAVPTVFTMYPGYLRAIINKTTIKEGAPVEADLQSNPPLDVVMEDEDSCSALLGTNGYEPVIITDNGFSEMCLKMPDKRVVSKTGGEPQVACSAPQKSPVTVPTSTGDNPCEKLRKRIKTDAKLMRKLQSRYRKAKKELAELRKIKNKKIHTISPNRECVRKNDVGLVFAELKEDAANGNDKAAFLLDQVANYKKMKKHWSESTLKHLSVLFKEWPKAYDYSRHSLLQLPATSTVRRYMVNNNSNSADGEVASTE